MNPLAAIYHPGGTDPGSYPVSAVDFITNWSEERGAVTEVVIVTTDGALRAVPMDRLQIVDRAVAQAIVAATEANEQQREQHGTIPPLG